MANEASFIYKLPLTYVRVTGTRSEVFDALTDNTSISCKSVVTTETAADPFTECRITLTPDALATRKTSWNLTSDGRLLGGDVATTAEPMAAWTASLSAAAAVVGAGAPLLAAGPPGWAALGIAAGVAGAATHLKVRGVLALKNDDDFSYVESSAPPAPPHDASPLELGIHPQYVSEHRVEAIALANYRATLSAATEKHALATRASVLANVPEEQQFWLGQGGYFQQVLMMTSVAAALAEEDYEKWKQSKLKISTVDLNYWLRIDDLPSRQELEEWAKSTSLSESSWTDLADRLRIAVSVSLDKSIGDNQKERRKVFKPLATDEELQYRPPRVARLDVWKLIPKSNGGYTLQHSEVRRISVAFPGNETVLSIAGDRETTNSLAATFDESGAMTKLTTENMDPVLQRAHDAAALIPALSAAAEAGNSIRKAFSPPSMVDRAAEAKAAQELGLTASPLDPQKELKTQLAEQQLRAQLNVAQQIASSSSFPVFVTVSN